MSSNKKSQFPSDDSRPNQVETPVGSANARRRLLKGAIGATPVVMAVTSRPVLAGICTVSGFMSGNLSTHNHNRYCGGRSPGYWKHRIPKNDKTRFYDRFKCVWRDGDGLYWPKPDAKYKTLGNLSGNVETPTFWQVLNMLGHEDQYQLGAHAVAAYMNAHNIPEYGLKPDEVTKMVQEVVAFGEYKDPRSGKVLDAQELVAFFSQTFDAD